VTAPAAKPQHTIDPAAAFRSRCEAHAGRWLQGKLVTEMRLTIRDISIHEKGESRWAQLPSKPQISKDGKVITKDGKTQYATILEFDSRAVREAFSNAVIASLLDRVPDAFEERAS
jgi:hypothetical protein